MMTVSPNDRTIEAYNDNILAYKKFTPSNSKDSNPLMLKWIDTSLSFISAGSRILEIGSATLRDATYIRERGHFVTCSDATPNFVYDLRAQGEDALLLNVVRDSLPEGYHMVFANSVFQHFSSSDVAAAIRNVAAALQAGGVFSFCVRLGEGEVWVTEKSIHKRYIHFWNIEAIKPILEQHSFEIIFIDRNVGDFPDHLWLNIIARKR